MTKTEPDAVSRLYGLPLEDFIRERDATARELKKQGDLPQAARIRKLVKPNLSAWAINQAVRSDPSKAKKLLDAGRRLEEAQAAAVSGKGRSALRGAMARQHEAIEELMALVEERLREISRSSAAVDRARETLRALPTDEGLRAELTEGRLTRDREAIGFGAMALGTVSDAGVERDVTATQRREAARREQRAARSLETAARKVREARRRVETAQRKLDDAQERHAEAEREQTSKQDELDSVRADLDRLDGDT